MAHVSAEARRDQLIAAAVQVVAREGADGATTRKIADEAQAPLASLHYCFQNKENLLFAVFVRLSEEMPFGVDLPETGNRDLGDVAALLLTSTMQWFLENPVQTRAMIEITLWAERHDPELSAGFYDTFLKLTEGVLRQANIPLSDDDLHSAVRVMMAVADGLSLQMLTGGGREHTLRDTATACAMFRAFLSQGARKPARKGGPDERRCQTLRSCPETPPSRAR